MRDFLLSMGLCFWQPTWPDDKVQLVCVLKLNLTILGQKRHKKERKPPGYTGRIHHVNVTTASFYPTFSETAIIVK